MYKRLKLDHNNFVKKTHETASISTTYDIKNLSHIKCIFEKSVPDIIDIPTHYSCLRFCLELTCCMYMFSRTPFDLHFVGRQVTI